MTSGRPIDEFGAMLHTKTRDTPNGEIAIELKITCTKQHPTGITTSMLRAITASDIRYRVGSKPSDADFYIKLHVPEAPVWKKGGRKLLTSDQLEVVAEIYIKALADNMAPTKVIQTWGKTSRPTASRWISQARQLGLIGQPTKKGLPGHNAKKDISLKEV